MRNNKEELFKIYEKTINKIDDMTEYREITSKDIKAILEQMYKEIVNINKKEIK